MQTLRSENDIDDWNHYIIQKHRPTREKTEVRIQSAADIRIGRACNRIKSGHAPITNGCKKHRDHCNEDGSYNVALGFLISDTKGTGCRDRLDQYNPIKNQVAQAQHAF